MMSFFWSDDAIVADLNWIKDELRQSRQREMRIKEILMVLQVEVQALVDAVGEQGEQIAAATDELVSLETHVAALEAQIGATKIDAEDLAAIVSVTGTVKASISKLKSAMPQPVAPAVVDAVVTPAEAPAPEAPPA